MLPILLPLDFMAKLAALVPRPRTNLTRFYGVLAPNSRYRDRVTPVSSGKVKKPTADAEADGRQEPDLTASKRKGMCCTEGHPAQRLKRVFNIVVSIPRRAPSLQCLWRPDEDYCKHRRSVRHRQDPVSSRGHVRFTSGQRIVALEPVRRLQRFAS